MMLQNLRRNVVTTGQKSFPRVTQIRSFWEYVNMMFNKPDVDRLKKFGPDRTCAEWVLRNGGSVVWSTGKKLADYNSLPPEKEGVSKVVEIDGTNSSISHYGFPHLMGCTMLKKITLHNASYIDDRALKSLEYATATLTHLQVSRCANVTDEGLKALNILIKLESLVLFQLDSVQNLEECKLILSKQLAACKISDGENGMERKT